MKNQISFDDFLKVEIHAGTIIEVLDFPKAKKPAFILKIDFGEEIGLKQSSAQITKLYSKENLIGLQILAVTNFPKKQIGNFFSEVLVLGTVNEEDYIVTLISPTFPVKNGERLS